MDIFNHNNVKIKKIFFDDEKTNGARDKDQNIMQIVNLKQRPHGDFLVERLTHHTLLK